MDLQRVEIELKKRLNYPYEWGRKQSNDWDRMTNFIYKTYSFETLLKKIENLEEDVQNYALNRWYNFWSAMAVEYIFATHKNVEANKNSYDKLVDFKINGIPFDHKTSVFPKEYNHSINFAKTNKTDLINWLYSNQSQQGRKHLKNRLFIVLYDSKGEHWKLKAEISLLQYEIDKYCKSFKEANLIKLDFGDGIVYSDIIFITNV
jgi:hypothetical protein